MTKTNTGGQNGVLHVLTVWQVVPMSEMSRWERMIELVTGRTRIGVASTGWRRRAWNRVVWREP